jgi:Pyruvate/2-oxoacid:ferredoxin oxidoreductase gamma subunit
VRTEIRLAGTGGMGVVLAGVILGHAAVTQGGLEAVQSQSYGSEARGTAVMNLSNTQRYENPITSSSCPRKHLICT